MGSDTTCRGDKHPREFPRIINIAYKDTLTEKAETQWIYTQLCYINYLLFSSLFNVGLHLHE